MIHEKLIVAGFGGQGVVFAGTLLSYAAMTEGLHTTFMKSYGVQMRGGTANASVVISSAEIASPIISRPTSAIVFNLPSLLRFEGQVVEGGVLVVNTSLASHAPARGDLVVIPIPATEIAMRLGEIRVANMVALGAYLRARPILKPSVILDQTGRSLRQRYCSRSMLLNLPIVALRLLPLRSPDTEEPLEMLFVLGPLRPLMGLRKRF